MLKYEDFEKEYPDCLILQLRGMFYNAFGDSAKLLSYLMDFKLNANESGLLKAGFPSSSENKVVRILKQHHISYVFFTNGVATGKCFFEDNEYDRLLKSCPDASAMGGSSDRKINENLSHGNTDKKKGVQAPIAHKTAHSDDLVEFMSLICEGKNPFSGDESNTIDLNDVKIIRMFYKVRDALMDL